MITSTQNEPQRYLVIIGSPSCSAMNLPRLLRVNSDTKHIEDLFTGEEQGYELVENMIDYSAEEIEATLKKFFSPGKLKSSDNVIVYYTGHGDEGGKFGSHYLFTVNSRSDNISGTAIKTSSLVDCFFENFENADPPSVLLFLDVCYAGQGAGEAISALADGWNKSKNRATGSGFWVIASVDAKTAAPDGAFVDALKEVMKDHDCIGVRDFFV